MKHLTANKARLEFDYLLSHVIKFGDSVSIATDEGAAILVSEVEWNGLLETLYLQSIPGMTESIKEAQKAPVTERLEDIGWDINQSISKRQKKTPVC